mmetsp:Transcript_14629/g.37375  ORF Transcript_14629/g.37375 Transcript_14629/m.37375 type:complete len:293 (+) Transcript_14629:1256-2134(+)
MSLPLAAPKPPHRGSDIFGHNARQAIVVAQPHLVLGIGALFIRRGLQQETESLAALRLHAFPFQVPQSELQLGRRVAALRAFDEPVKRHVTGLLKQHGRAARIDVPQTVALGKVFPSASSVVCAGDMQIILAELEMGFCIARICTEMEEMNALGDVLLNAHARHVHPRQFLPRDEMSLLSALRETTHGFLDVGADTETVEVAVVSQMIQRRWMSVIGGFAQPHHSALVILCDTHAVETTQAEAELRLRNPSLRTSSVQFSGRCIIAGHAPAVLQQQSQKEGGLVVAVVSRGA